MKTLNLYVTRAFLVTFFMALGVLTFGMTGARIARILDVIANGLPISAFLQFLVYIMPVVLTFTIPWAIMAAVMLVFGRLSADSEITAMRACGISLLQVVSPIILITLMITALCLYIQLFVAPISYFKARQLTRDAAINQPIAMFEPGRPLHYENTIIYIDDKIDNKILKNVQIYTVDPKRPGEVAQDVTAGEGHLEMDRENQILTIVLKNCLTIDKKSKQETRVASDELRFHFNYGKSITENALFRAPKYMSATELMARIRDVKKLSPRNRKMECSLECQLNCRIALGLSPIAFLLLGMPLAIRTSRKETSVGLFLSVLLAGTFFISILLLNSMTGKPQLYPQYLLWLPNIIFQALGAYLTFKVSHL
ncbi:MAG: LptF/LptG family permease [Lentisphaeria bacterium]|nr:LptF/LptG family permease [Lentisphaeria bacterium]